MKNGLEIKRKQTFIFRFLLSAKSGIKNSRLKALEMGQETLTEKEREMLSCCLNVNEENLIEEGHENWLEKNANIICLLLCAAVIAIVHININIIFIESISFLPFVLLGLTFVPSVILMFCLKKYTIRYLIAFTLSLILANLVVLIYLAVWRG